MATLNAINRFYFFLFGAIIILFVFSNAHFKMDFSALWLFTLGLSFAIFSPETTSSLLGVLKPFSYAIAYIIGLSIYGKLKDKPQYKGFYVLTVTIVAGSTVHFILNFITNRASSDRNIVDFWSQTSLAATGQAAIALLTVALAIGCLFSDFSLKYKLISLIAIITVALYNLLLAGRTLFIMMILLIALAFLFRLYSSSKKRFQFIVITAFILFLSIIIWNSNLFNVRNIFENSNFYQRFFGQFSGEITSDSRGNRKLFYLQNLTQYPFGGVNMRDYVGYAHYIILDTYDEASIFAALAVILYLIASLSRLISVIRNKSLPFSLRQITICLYIACYIEFCIEPILQGMPWLFVSFCIIDGYIKQILNAPKAKTASQRKMIV